jgi:hypothetical protein
MSTLWIASSIKLTTLKVPENMFASKISQKKVMYHTNVNFVDCVKYQTNDFKSA